VEVNAEKYISYFEWILDESECELRRSSFRTKWKSLSMLYRREMGMSMPDEGVKDNLECTLFSSSNLLDCPDF
jgi:hypothetical protein